MPHYYLSLGGNIGDVEGHMLAALESLLKEGARLKKLSSAYNTPPWGFSQQDWFINACCLIEAQQEPENFLLKLQAIEYAQKRQRLQKWGPRTLDIDILYVPTLTSYKSPTLTLPHPLLTERAFVLSPLAEIAPSLNIKGKKVSVWAAQQQDDRIIKRPVSSNWEAMQKLIVG